MWRARDFARVRRAGRRLARPPFVIYALRAPGETKSLGIICGRRVGNAVARNRARRRLREVFRHNPDLFRDGYWFVVVARAAAAIMPFAELRADVRAALKELVGQARDENASGD